VHQVPSDIPDRSRGAEQPFEIGARDAYSDVARRLPRTVTARDAARETDAAPEEDDRAQQAMFEDIDAVLARVERGIAIEHGALNALLDRLSNAA
jgi:hypothetical protein